MSITNNTVDVHEWLDPSISEETFVRELCLSGFRTVDELLAVLVRVEQWAKENSFKFEHKRSEGYTGKPNRLDLSFKKLPPKRYCKDCKHFVASDHKPMCAFTKVKAGDLVSGEDVMQPCSTMRFSTFIPNACGESGIHFVPKEGYLKP